MEKETYLLFTKQNKKLLDAEFKQCLANVEKVTKYRGFNTTICYVKNTGDYIQRCEDLTKLMETLGYEVSMCSPVGPIHVSWS